VWWREGRHTARARGHTVWRREGWHSVGCHWSCRAVSIGSCVVVMRQLTTSAAHEVWRHSTHGRHSWWREPRHTHRWHSHWGHSAHRSSREATSQVLLEQRVGLAFCVVCVGNTIDDLLCLVARYLLVVGLDVAEVVAAVVVRLPHAHTVVGEVDIAVVAEELRHRVQGVRLGAEMGYWD